jgi:DNA mismatch repair ATPase MutS
LLGSRAYVSSLAGKRGLGFIATHDLQLAGLAGDMSQVVNYHFRDYIKEGCMVFDYRLRPGPSPTTNALTIMALEGLPTPPVQGSTNIAGGAEVST